MNGAFHVPVCFGHIASIALFYSVGLLTTRYNWHTRPLTPD